MFRPVGFLGFSTPLSSGGIAPGLKTGAAGNTEVLALPLVPDVRGASTVAVFTITVQSTIARRSYRLIMVGVRI